MELTQNKIDLISRVIKRDRKFKGNEDLFDDFFNETCERSSAIINTIDNEVTLEAYIKRIANTAIVNVLKDAGRLRRSGSRYMSVKDVSSQEDISLDDFIDYSAYNISYKNIDIPKNPEEIAIQNEVLDFVAETIIKIDAQEPQKDYLHIYKLRYDKGMTQREIADEIGVSQSEVSKRLYSLIGKVKEILEQ
ncbi:sigma-70 family RNA polymerase sigma factor [bacterium]|nr:sigma-70 family RNA polymerase sigma factor [bacterium]